MYKRKGEKGRKGRKGEDGKKHKRKIVIRLIVSPCDPHVRILFLRSTNRRKTYDVYLTMKKKIV